MKRKIHYCPYCGASATRFRSRAKNWICNECGRVFSNPVIKEKDKVIRKERKDG